MPIERDLAGSAAFIICGGPSVDEQNLELLRGHTVVVVNSSFRRVPWADVLLFADSRWFGWNKDKLPDFRGRVVTVFDNNPIRKYPPHFEQYRKSRPPELSRDPNALSLARTTVTGAINYLGLRGASPIVTLGLDLKAAVDASGKRKTHHHEPHPIPSMKGSWERHNKELCSIVPSLKAMGIEVINASPGSACSAFPIVTLEEAL
jgi:hypothetical protein